MPALVAISGSLLTACLPMDPSGPVPTGSAVPTALATSTTHPSSPRIEHATTDIITTGTPIAVGDLSGRILFDDFEDVFAMDIDGSNVVRIADQEGSEFDGAWSPDGNWVVYRDSTRGINEDDEIFVARADGTDRRNISNNPANDWGPDWSPDGETIVFNSDRSGSIRGYLASPDGSNVRPVAVDAWVEYPAFSPDGTRIAFSGALGNNYELFVADLASGSVTRLTDSPGHDNWPAWSPDGTTIAFTSVRDDCGIAPRSQECWRGDGPGDEHSDVWLIAPDGTNLRRATTMNGQFVAWSPDSRYVLVSGRALYVIRPDGTGRLELRAEGLNRALGGIPDWGQSD